MKYTCSVHTPCATPWIIYIVWKAVNITTVGLQLKHLQQVVLKQNQIDLITALQNVLFCMALNISFVAEVCFQE